VTVLVRCIEPLARPRFVELRLEDGQGFTVYALQDALEGLGELRATVLRGDEELPPRGAIPLLSLQPLPSTDREIVLLVRDLGIADIEWHLPGRTSHVIEGTRLPSDARLEAAVPGRRRLQFAFEVSGAGVAGVRAAIAGSGAVPRRKAVKRAGALWLVPGLYNVLNDTKDVAFDTMKDLASRLGLSPRMVASLASVLSVGLIGLFGWYQQYKETKAVEEQAAGLAAELELAQASNSMTLQSEQVCLQERRDLVAQLGDQVQAKLLRMDAALAPTASRSAALQGGGARLASEALLEHDALALQDLERRLVALAGDLAAPGPESARCLAFERQLETDLPRYALLWHPDPEASCPEAYAGSPAGVEVVGRWGLSQRAVDDFGVLAPVQGFNAATTDPRLNDRWAARVFTAGLRAAQNTLLAAGGERPSVAPSQAQLWGLTFWGAYNAMPSPAGGVLDEGIEDCVAAAMATWATRRPAASPSDPVLPDLLTVLDGEAKLSLTPTPGCPWPPGVLDEAVRGAFRAVGRASHLDPPEDG
jgi:hypothetical protein